MPSALPEFLWRARQGCLYAHESFDFWNLQLHIYEQAGRDYKLDWKKLSPLLVDEAEKLLGTALHFEGTNVYLSYHPNTSQGKKLRNWAINTLDRFSGIRVIAKEQGKRTTHLSQLSSIDRELPPLWRANDPHSREGN